MVNDFQLEIFSLIQCYFNERGKANTHELMERHLRRSSVDTDKGTIVKSSCTMQLILISLFRNMFKVTNAIYYYMLSESLQVC